MATEDQISQLYSDIVAAEQRRDYCCRDIIVWEAHVQIVRLNTNAITAEGVPSSGGVVIETFEDNIAVGTTRRGLSHTVTFPVKWDDNLYFPVTPEQNILSNTTSCSSLTVGNNSDTKVALVNDYATIVQYRYSEDSTIAINNCNVNTTNRSGFFAGVPNANNMSPGQKRSTYTAMDDRGYMARVGDNWGQFVRDIKDDGTVTLTNNSRNTNYNIIRYYTQWTLDVCGNGSRLSDNTWPVQPRR